MKPLVLTDDLEKVVRRVFWFESLDRALSDPIRFVTYAMTYGTHEDMTVVRKYFTDAELKEVLAKHHQGFLMNDPGPFGMSSSVDIPPHHPRNGSWIEFHTRVC